jgi:hypothetical protein
MNWAFLDAQNRIKSSGFQVLRFVVLSENPDATEYMLSAIR